MNVELLIIDLLPPAGPGTAPASSKPGPAKNINPFEEALANSSPSPDITEETSTVLTNDNPPEIPATDNNVNNTQNEPADPTQQLPQQQVGENLATAAPSTAQNNDNPQSKGPLFAVATQPSIVQQWLSEQPLIEHGEKGIARDMQPKAGFELAQSLAELKSGNFPSPLNGEQNTSNLNAVITDTSETTPATSQQIDETLTLALGLDKPVIIAENISQQPAGEQLITQALNDNSENTTDQKGMVVAEPVVSTGQKIPVQLTNNELVLEPTDTGDKTTSNSEKPVIESASDTSGNPRTTVLQIPSLKAQIQSSNNTDTTNSSLTGNDLPLDVGQPTVNKSNTYQQTNPAQQNLLVSSDGNSDSDSPPQSDTTSGDILNQNLNPAQLHISANRTKNRAGSSPNDSNFQLLISHSNTQNTITDQTLASATTVAKAQSSAYPSNLSANLNEQIIQSIQSSLQQDQQQIIIRLKPPELGKVLIQFQQEQDQITGLLQVDKAETRAQIQQELPQIIQNLQDSGIQIKRLDVILQDQQQDYRDQTLQNGTFQQQQQAFSDTNSSDNNITNEWLINETDYPGLPEPQDSFVTENSINILI